MNQLIVQFVLENSYFEFEEYDDENRIYSFVTRLHGNSLDKEFSPKDYSAALELKKKVLEKFSNVEVNIDTCDEWVSVYIVDTI